MKRCWIVASDDAVGRWKPALEAAGVEVVPLVARRREPPRNVSAIHKALRAGAHDLVLLTSANAVAYIEPQDAKEWVAAAVGARTAHAAREIGFEVPFVGGAGAAQLAATLLDEDVGDVLFLRGEEALDEASRILRAGGVAVDEIVAYRMRPEPTFPRAVASAPAPDTIVVGSPAAADLLLEAVAPPAGARWVALGPTTRAHLTGLGIEGVLCSASPRIEDLVTAVTLGVDP